MMIPITKPYFGPEELRAVQLPLESGWVVQGRFVKEFENKFCEFTGARHAIATTSCTTALHIAVTALGLKPKDEVIVPAFTWISTPNVVEYKGATPIFCDIDLKTFNIKTEDIESLITNRTVGIIPVHLFGLCADMEPILQIGKKYNLWVVEDAACALGSLYQGKHAGTLGHLGCFSFHPRKSITTGEGGMITTSDRELDRLSRILRDHGASHTDFDRDGKKFSFLLGDFNHLGFNYRMTDIQGALGCVQMEKAGWILKERSRRATLYHEMLSGLDWLKIPQPQEGYLHSYQAYVCLFTPEEPSLKNLKRMAQQRTRLMERLEEKGIATRQGTHAPVVQGYYTQKYNFKPEEFPNAVIADRLTITLPLYVQMTDEEQSLVVEELIRSYNTL